MSKIAIFFGPADGSVHRVAKLVASKIGEERIHLIHVNDASADDIARYDKIIFGISTVGKETWDQEFSNADWAKFMPFLYEFNFKGKKIAIFGLGDHITYAYHFVNSMGSLAQIVIQNGGELIGRVSAEGYVFQDSEALENGEFLGLPVDEDFEPELTDARVTAWVEKLIKEF
jgi:flavodoxin I